MKQTPFYYTLWRLLALSIMSLLTLATLSLTSCRHKDTEHDDYGLSAALSWEDPADAGREIKNVRIWIFQAGGFVAGFFSIKAQANSWLSVSMVVSF